MLRIIVMKKFSENISIFWGARTMNFCLILVKVVYVLSYLIT